MDEIKSSCALCESDSVLNLKLVDGKASTRGPQIKLGSEESYVPVCRTHYWEQLSDIDRPVSTEAQTCLRAVLLSRTTLEPIQKE
mmetsp:Transcript_46879/g.92270  ORF Transcript_46879/g.92270 Transcript_46879/m.92270 type:complete len:85 (-) Transcript_46879:29-283(-)